MWLKIVLEVKTKRGLKVIEKIIDQQIEIMTRVGFYGIDVLTDTVSTSLYF